jgi:hypothetical protein
MRNLGFLKLAFAGVVLVAVVSSGLALGANPFVDVPATKFYAEPVDWAYNNALTTGSPAGSDTFKPEDPVTRGENITFNYRYDQNIVQPELEARTVGLFASDDRGADFIYPDLVSTDLGLSATATVPEGHTGVIEIEFSSGTTCGGGSTGGFCVITIFNNGVAVGYAEQIMDSSDNGVESGNAWESHTVRRVTDVLGEGDYEVTVEARRGTGSPGFTLRNALVTAQVHLVS